MSKKDPSPTRLIPLGRVVGVHGLKGMLRVRLSGKPGELDPETFKAVGEILLGGEPFRVTRAARGRRHVLLGLAGVNTREQAEALVGREVQAEARRFPELSPGEYYWFQVLGLPVVHAEAGAVLGTLEEIWPTGAHDVFVVRQGEREILLPAVEEIIKEIDLDQGVIRVLPPPGLLELYAD